LHFLDIQFNNNTPFDVINMNILFNNKIFCNNIIEEEEKVIKNNLKEIATKLLLKEKLSKNSESKIDKLINKKLNDIKLYFENLFMKQLPDISNDLAECLGELVNKIDNDLNKKYQVIYLSGIYNHNRLKKEAKDNIILSLKPLIAKRVFKEIHKKIFKIFCNEFSKKLIEYFDFLINNNRGFNNIFKNKGKENSKCCCDKIKSQLKNQFPVDDYNIKNGKNINNMNNMNNMNYINNFNNNMNNNINNMNKVNNLNYMNNMNNMNNNMNMNNINNNMNMNNMNNNNMNNNNMNNMNNDNINNKKNLYNTKGPNISLFDEI